MTKSRLLAYSTVEKYGPPWKEFNIALAPAFARAYINDKETQK